MSNEARLISLIKTMALEAMKTNKPMEYAVGIVEAEPPELKIRLSQKLLLTKEFLILTRNITDVTTEISFDDPDIKQVFTTWDMAESDESKMAKISFKAKQKHLITIYNALKTGEKVILLRLQGGNSYLVLDRLVSE